MRNGLPAPAMANKAGIETKKNDQNARNGGYQARIRSRRINRMTGIVTRSASVCNGWKLLVRFAPERPATSIHRAWRRATPPDYKLRVSAERFPTCELNGRCRQNCRENNSTSQFLAEIGGRIFGQIAPLVAAYCNDQRNDKSPDDKDSRNRVKRISNHRPVLADELMTAMGRNLT
jgi:hypothetical protein